MHVSSSFYESLFIFIVRKHHEAKCNWSLTLTEERARPEMQELIDCAMMTLGIPSSELAPELLLQQHL